MESLIDNKKVEVQKVKDLESRIIEFKADMEGIISSKLHDMLSQIIKIDGNKPVLSNNGNQEENPEEEFKEGRVTAESALTFLM